MLLRNDLFVQEVLVNLYFYCRIFTPRKVYIADAIFHTFILYIEFVISVVLITTNVLRHIAQLRSFKSIERRVKHANSYTLFMIKMEIVDFLGILLFALCLYKLPGRLPDVINCLFISVSVSRHQVE